jgi:hypothetical protein
MSFQTFEGVLYPDGKLSLQTQDLPSHPVRVMVTLMEQQEERPLTELGDYHEQLTSYEERLLRGEIHWQ